MNKCESKIKAIIGAADSSLSESGKVRIDIYGGDIDESCLRGNKAGLLYFGIKLLQAAYTPNNKEIELTDLFHGNTDVRVDYIKRTEDLELNSSVKTVRRSVQKTKLMIWFAVVIIVLITLMVITIHGY